MSRDKKSLRKGAARSFRHLCKIAGLSPRKLSGLAGVSVGSVWNYLHAKTMRADLADRIHRQIANHASRLLGRGKVAASHIDFIRSTVATKNLYKKPNENAGVQQGESSSLKVATHVAELVMALTDDPRLNLAKDFEYAHERHFRAHARCVLRGIKYRWLVYENPGLIRQWKRYLRKLISHIATEERNNIDDVRKRLEEKGTVEFRVYPRITQEEGRLLPFRITVFAVTRFDPQHEGAQRECDVCVLTEEPDVKTYSIGRTFVLGRPIASAVRSALEDLYEKCPRVDELQDAKTYEEKAYDLYDDLVKRHNQLRAQILRACLEHRFMEPAVSSL